MDVRAEALSALRWWQEAGVDTLVDELPRDWLRQAAPAAPTAAPAVPASDLPTTLTALTSWLLDPASLPDLGPRRLAPSGAADARLMLLVDMPETGDSEAGALLSGAAGRLLDRMLAAIGRDRSTVYLTSVCPARPTGGRLAPAAAELLGRIARRHVALARPKVTIAFGQAAATALGLAWPPGRGRLDNLNHDGGTVAAIATFHPRFLLERPACKAEAWADLRAAHKELAR